MLLEIRFGQCPVEARKMGQRRLTNIPVDLHTEEILWLWAGEHHRDVVGVFQDEFFGVTGRPLPNTHTALFGFGVSADGDNSVWLWSH